MKPTASQKPDLRTETFFQKVRKELQSHSASPYQDALVLLAHISGRSKSQILADPDLQLNPQQEQTLDQALDRLSSGVPLPYVLGEWEFFKLTLKITEDVLIPRPETEGLVELALSWLEKHPERRECLEIGTGSGCIAITLAKNIPDLTVTATDISPAALKIAKENAAIHGVSDRVNFLVRDLLDGFTTPVDLLVANLPYIPRRKLESLSVFKTEPVLALDGGEDGLVYIKDVLKNSKSLLHPQGAILLELDEDCGATALDLARGVWPGSTLKLDQDLSGQDRYLSVYIDEC